MPSKLILVSTLVAFLLSPNEGAIGTIALHDGFPSMSNSTFFEIGLERSHCFFEDIYDENNSVFNFMVTESGIQTGYVNCPAANRHTAAFSADYKESIIQSYTSPDQHRNFSFSQYESLPNDVGLDPLRTIRWEPTDAQDRLVKLGRIFQNERLMIFVNDSFAVADEELQASEKLRNVCDAALERVKQRYPTFQDLCAEYREIAEEAVRAVS